MLHSSQSAREDFSLSAFYPLCIQTFLARIPCVVQGVNRLRRESRNGVSQDENRMCLVQKKQAQCVLNQGLHRERHQLVSVLSDTIRDKSIPIVPGHLASKFMGGMLVSGQLPALLSGSYAKTGSSNYLGVQIFGIMKHLFFKLHSIQRTVPCPEEAGICGATQMAVSRYCSFVRRDRTWPECASDGI